MSVALALPEPATITPAQIPEYCRAVEAEALATDDPTVVAEMHARWSALTQYLAVKSRDGIALAKATELRLLARIGELSPAGPTGRAAAKMTAQSFDPDPGSETGLSPNRMVEARHLAAHPDVVEAVIADGTDAAPPTKAEVLRRIRADQTPPPATCEEDMSEPNVGEQILKLHADGLTQRQIGDRLGIASSSVHRHIAAMGLGANGTRATLDRLMAQLAGLADAAENIDGQVLNPTSSEVGQWTADLTRTIRSLSRLRKRINERNQL